MREGTVFHYRIVVEGRMSEYSSKVIAFEPNRLMETQTNTDPMVKFRVKITPLSEGVCLEQEITASITQQESTPVELPAWFAKLIGRLEKETNSAEKGEALLKKQESLMEEQIQAQLEEWLVIVKKHLEEQCDQFFA